VCVCVCVCVEMAVIMKIELFQRHVDFLCSSCSSNPQCKIL